MSDDYLWDRSGDPDPEIANLERTLESLGAREEFLASPPEGKAGAAPSAGPAARPVAIDLGPVPPVALRPRRPRLVFVWAAAATLVAIVAAAIVWTSLRPDRAWEVARLEGAPRVGAGAIRGTGILAVGEWLETDSGSRARLKVGRIGELLVEPNTRLRLLGSGSREHRLHLALGTVTAVILAPPRQFVVETPSAAAVDLGCAYTLQVDPLGAGLVTVIAGWVSFESEGRESFIPAGARCATRPGLGPGTPYFTDASDAFKNALAALDLAGGEAVRSAPLTALLAAARREDALTLWHLLARLGGAERDSVYARLATLVPPPAGVTRTGVLAGDRSMLDLWWNALGLGEMKYWRMWQRSWPQPEARRPVAAVRDLR